MARYGTPNRDRVFVWMFAWYRPSFCVMVSKALLHTGQWGPPSCVAINTAHSIHNSCTTKQPLSWLHCDEGVVSHPPHFGAFAKAIAKASAKTSCMEACVVGWLVVGWTWIKYLCQTSWLNYMHKIPVDWITCIKSIKSHAWRNRFLKIPLFSILTGFINRFKIQRLEESISKNTPVFNLDGFYKSF